MGTLSDFAENEILDHVFGAGTYTPPGTLYFALSTSAPNDDGTNVTEPSGNGYARAAFTNNKTNWGDAASRTLSNDVAISFAQASGSWGTLTHWAIYDALTSGNMIAHGALTASKAVGDGDTPRFKIGDVDVSFSAGGFADYLANEILDHLFGAATFTAAATLYIALSTAATTDAGSATEPSGNGYARDSFANNKTNWGDAAAGALDNDVDIVFADPSGSWGSCTHFAIFDAVTSGNMYAHGALDTAKTPDDGDTVQSTAGDLNISLA